MKFSEIYEPQESKLNHYIQHQDWMVAYFKMRYASGYLLGIFTNKEVFDRLRDACNYEYEQGEFRELCISPGILPFVQCEDLGEGYQKLEAMIAKFQHVDLEDYYELEELMLKAFKLDDTYDDDAQKKALHAIVNFKTKWALK